MFSTSLKTSLEALVFPPGFFPNKPMFINFATAWERTSFFYYLKNSILITILTILGQLFVCVPAAYSFAKKEFKGKSVLFGFVLFDLMIPAQVVFLPIYIIISRLNWIDTYKALIIPFTFSSFSIFFLTQSFKQVSNELFDSALIDRANVFQIIFQILLPICKPVIITVVIFTFIYKWNDYFWTMILTTKDAVRTLPMAIRALTITNIDEGVVEWNIVMAGNVMLMLPLFILYIVANKAVRNAFAYSGQTK
jgi:sn-glycerol 3-phosphate transport system permease protein